MMARADGRMVVRAGRRRGPRRPRPDSSSSRCAFCSREVHFALESGGWNCTFDCEVHVSASGAPAAASARLAAALPGPVAGAGCPNLLQRPESHRSARRESLIFRASTRRRSRRETPLQQIWTRLRPRPPQEPHQHHSAPSRPRHHDDPSPRTAAPDEKGSLISGGSHAHDPGRRTRLHRPGAQGIRDAAKRVPMVLERPRGAMEPPSGQDPPPRMGVIRVIGRTGRRRSRDSVITDRERISTAHVPCGLGHRRGRDRADAGGSRVHRPPRQYPSRTPQAPGRHGLPVRERALHSGAAGARLCRRRVPLVNHIQGPQTDAGARSRAAGPGRRGRGRPPPPLEEPDVPLTIPPDDLDARPAPGGSPARARGTALSPGAGGAPEITPPVPARSSRRRGPRARRAPG